MSIDLGLCLFIILHLFTCKPLHKMILSCVTSIVLGGVCRSTTAALRIHRLGPRSQKTGD